MKRQNLLVAFLTIDAPETLRSISHRIQTRNGISIILLTE